MDAQTRFDVVLDTDAYNEIDDQFAIAYLLRSHDVLHVCALYAAPFFNDNSCSAQDGMYKSYDEILKVLSLAGRSDLARCVFHGSENYLPDEYTPVFSDAAQHLADLAGKYTPEQPLYVIAIGAITNVASAILLKPENAKNMVVIWLGGNSYDFHDTKEFNMYQDIAAARVVLSSDAYVVQLPCNGVVSEFRTTKPELAYWLQGKNALCDYLYENTLNAAARYAAWPWSRAIWDVTAVAYLLNEHNRFMMVRKQKTRLPDYAFHYAEELDKEMSYVYYIHRDALFLDLFTKLSQKTM